MNPFNISALLCAKSEKDSIVELLGHRQHVEHLIQYLSDDIGREKRRDFIGY